MGRRVNLRHVYFDLEDNTLKVRLRNGRLQKIGTLAGGGLVIDEADGGPFVGPVDTLHFRGTDAVGMQVIDDGGGAAHVNVNVSSGSFPTEDQKAALNAAASPSATNPFATLADLP